MNFLLKALVQILSLGVYYYVQKKKKAKEVDHAP